MRFDAYDERARDIEAKILGAGNFEAYLAPGANQPYVCILINPQAGTVVFYNTTYDNQNHKRIRTEDLSLWRMETRFTDSSYTCYLFISWDAYADKLPEHGDVWEFENVQWGRGGNLSWNGLESIHGRSSWGTLSFVIAKEGLRDIKRKLIFNALARYKNEKKTSQTHEGIIDFWSDSAVGDPRFFNACVKPLMVKLDAYMPLVSPKMTAEDVDRVFDEAVYGWNNIRYLVSEIRRKYLSASLIEQ